MSGITFSTQVSGKWVLAGEHTVLRGGAAIAVPHPEFRLKLEFRPAEGILSVEPDLATPILNELLRIAKDWLATRGTVMESPRGRVTIKSTIPFGAGLGSSAALSVAIARWILSAHSLDQALERELARELENRFHGKSSGMDVAVVSIGAPISFSMKEGAIGLGLQHLPKFVFTDSGIRAATRDCIERVEKLRLTDPARSEALDLEMRLATAATLDGLRAYDEAVIADSPEKVGLALDIVAKGMRRAGEVFAAWGLVPKEVETMIRKLEAQGIRSPRLTGAGGGGFIVGLSPENYT
jgi:mevalonate kinase